MLQRSLTISQFKGVNWSFAWHSFDNIKGGHWTSLIIRHGAFIRIIYYFVPISSYTNLAAFRYHTTV